MHVKSKTSSAQRSAPCTLQAWDGEGTGLIVSERLVNCPPQLAPPLVKGLFEEISAAATAKVRLFRHANGCHSIAVCNGASFVCPSQRALQAPLLYRMTVCRSLRGPP